MSRASSVGQRSIYEDGDQRKYRNEKINTVERCGGARPNSYPANDSKDQRPISNRLVRQEKFEHEPGPKSLEATIS